MIRLTHPRLLPMHRSRRYMHVLSIERLEDRRLLAVLPQFPDNQSPEFNRDMILDIVDAATPTVGQPLTLDFSGTASDADGDLPLRFMLDPDPEETPAGASITPAGIFTFTPTATGTLTFILLVTDSGSPPLADAESFTIDVLPNHPPVLNSIGDKEVNEGALLTFIATATDPDLPPNTLTFSLDTGFPTGASIDPSTGVFTWTPTEAQGPGTFPITIRVTDNGTPAFNDSETITVTVNEVNQAPVLAEIGNRTVDEGTELTFTAMATDADLPPNTLAFSLDAGAPTGAMIDPVTGAFTWTPTEDQGRVEPYEITIRVTDNGTPALNDFETITVTVNEVNQVPVLAAIGNRSVDEGSLLTFTAMASDADLPPNTLTFSLDAGAPGGATIDPVTGVFEWTPTESDGPGSFPITIRVTDNGTPALNDFETITVTVNEVNQVPVLAAIGNRSVDEGSLLTFTAMASDADLPPNTLTFSLDAGAPGGATIDPVTGVFEWIPTESDGPGSFPITIRVTDNGTPAFNDFETITVTVNEVNQVPVLAEIGNRTVDEGTELTFTATATDPDLPPNTLTFSLDAGAPAGATIHPITGLFQWTPTEAQGPGTYPITIRVTDNGTPAFNDFETIDITVNEVNTAPTLAPIPNQTAEVGMQLTVNLAGSVTDPDVPTNAITFSLDPDTTPTGASITSAGVFTFTPAAGGVYTIGVRVVDNGEPALDDTGTITVDVDGTNDAPNLAPIADQTTNVGNPVSFDLGDDVTDESGLGNLNFQLVQVDGQPIPEGAAITPKGVFTFSAASPATFVFRVLVTDAGSLTDSETFTITVNGPPTVANAIADLTVDEDAAPTLNHVDLDDVFSDVETDGQLIYTVPGNTPPDIVTAAVDTDGTLDLSYVTNANGTVTITVRATDPGGLFVEDTFTVNVTPAVELQVVTPGESELTAAPSSPVAIDVFYDTMTPSNNTLTGLGLRIHFDSSQLTFDMFTGPLTPGLQSIVVPQADASNFDGDNATNMFALVVWVDINGMWPNVALPVRLYTANFTTSAGFSGSTTINFTASSTAADYAFLANSATITALGGDASAAAADAAIEGLGDGLDGLLEDLTE